MRTVELSQAIRQSGSKRAVLLVALLGSFVFPLRVHGQDDAGSAEGSPDHATDGASSLSATFGPSGLLAEHNSNENFGAVQSRLGAYRAHQAFAEAGGPLEGYRDIVETKVFPIKAIVPIPGSGRRWFLKSGTVSIFSRGSDGNLTGSNSDTYSAQLAVLHLVDDRTLIGVGPLISRVNVDLLHNGGSVSSNGKGVQFDLLHKIDDRLGFSARAAYERLETRTTVPIGFTRRVETSQDADRLYVEASAVYNPSGSQILLPVPDGWFLRPIATLIFQATWTKFTTDSQGGPVAANTENFGTVLLSVRLEKDDFRPWHLVPYFVGGTEIEYMNDASSVDQDAGNLYVKAGVATNVGGKGRLDIYYARRESFRGTYSAGTFNMLLSMQF